MKATLRTDGGARGNPGPAGIGVLLVDENGREIAAGGRFVGTATNNVAEYMALITGLEAARAAGVTDLTVCCDSELVVKQMRGEYRVRNEALKPLFARASDVSRGFDSVRFVHVRRAENQVADQLANQAMDARHDVGYGLSECDEPPSTLF